MGNALKRTAALFISAVMLMMCLTVFCSPSVSAAGKVKLSRTSITLEEGETASLKLTGTSGGTIRWSMSDSSVAKYSKGKVTAVGEGTAYIYAKYKGKKYTCKVTVTSDGEELYDDNDSDISTVNVKKGGTVKVYFYTDSTEIRYGCSNAKVCSISASAIGDGSGFVFKIKGKSSGTASIKIIGNKDSAEFDVEVGSRSDGTVYIGDKSENTISVDSGWGDTSSDNDNSESSESYVDEVIRLVNEEREAAGKKPLKKLDELCENADLRAKELKDTFSHTRPNGKSCFTAITVDYGYAGENIAMGQCTPEEVMDSWMGSSGHKKNILSSNYTAIGVGYDPETNCWVQIFISE